MLVVRTTIPLDPARREAAMGRIDELEAHARTEAGTVRYYATQDRTDPNVVRFFEVYEDEAAAVVERDATDVG